MSNFKRIFLLFFFLFFLPLITVVQAAALNFDKTTVSVGNDKTFQVAVTVDPGSDALSSVDAYVTFNSDILIVTEVTAGSLFPTVSHDESTSGKVYIAGMVNDPASSITTSGTLATITFQTAKTGTGTVSLSFDCNTSKIIKNDINASNLINCSQNGTVAVKIGDCPQNSTGGTPSTDPNCITQPPTQLPKTGILDNVIKFAIPGMILLFMGGILKFVL